MTESEPRGSDSECRVTGYLFMLLSSESVVEFIVTLARQREIVYRGSVVGFLAHEVFCRVVAGGTLLRRCDAFVDVAADLALPLDGLAVLAAEHGSVLDLPGHGQEALAVMVLDRGDGGESVSDLVEAFLAGNCGGVSIQLDAFELLLVRGYLQIVDSLADNAGVYSYGRSLCISLEQVFKEYLGMVQLIVRGLGEYVRELRITFLLGLLAEECVTCVCA